jgi:hypothetical protein
MGGFDSSIFAIKPSSVTCGSRSGRNSLTLGWRMRRDRYDSLCSFRSQRSSCGSMTIAISNTNIPLLVLLNSRRV